MTNEELKKKIVEIIQSVDFYDGLLYRYCIDIATADKLADALIAAGIGDVKVLETALQIAECDSPDYTYDDFIEQAEKELVEGKKDD